MESGNHGFKFVLTFDAGVVTDSVMAPAIRQLAAIACRAIRQADDDAGRSIHLADLYFQNCVAHTLLLYSKWQ